MKWFHLNSLKKRYAALTIILAIFMLSFSWYAENKINNVKLNIEKNISSRNTLLQQSREVRSSLLMTRDLLFKFQIDPKNYTDKKYIPKSIEKTISHINQLSSHPWIKDNYSKTTSELIKNMTEFEKISIKLVNVRLKPQLLFPALNIANNEMQPMSAIFIENINLAIKELHDQPSLQKSKEYLLLIDLRFHWSTMISSFRMYLLNQLNAFHDYSRAHQLDTIQEVHLILKTKLNTIKKLKKMRKLSFTTEIAEEQFYPAALKWIAGFDKVRDINNSKGWRTDTIVYQNELEPKLEKINMLLYELDLGIARFSHNDLAKLSNIAELQVNALWSTIIFGLFILLSGYIFLVKFILDPIASVTHALKDESKGIITSIPQNKSIQETKNLISAFKEMRRQIHTRQQELEYHALHDSLTGLANRELFNNRLIQAIENAQQERNSFAILIMDLDRFKEVNDTLGHGVGDKLLQQVAKRLENLLREVDIVVRLGGDEFAVLLSASQEEQAKTIAKKIINDFHTVFTIDNTPLYIGISIGISVYPQHGTTVQVLQQRADVAMYVAKRNKTGYDVYNQKHDDYSIGRLSLISDLRNAINDDQLFMEYQPIIDLATGKVVSAEALLRWRHPERGVIYPDTLIPIAEQTGLINSITYWIIDTTAKYNKKLIENDINIKISINLSVYNLQDKNFIKNIIDIYEKNNISSAHFIMEVTESVMMTTPEKSIDILNQLDKLSVEIAVDDFGTGYSSLTYLKRLPLSKLKIDKSFIMDMIDDDDDGLIVRSTIELAHNLGMQVVAEGIENKEALELLNVMGCELGQGYFIKKPVPENKFQEWIINQEHT